MEPVCNWNKSHGAAEVPYSRMALLLCPFILLHTLWVGHQKPQNTKRAKVFFTTRTPLFKTESHLQRNVTLQPCHFTSSICPVQRSVSHENSFVYFSRNLAFFQLIKINHEKTCKSPRLNVMCLLPVVSLKTKLEIDKLLSSKGR